MLCRQFVIAEIYSTTYSNARLDIHLSIIMKFCCDMTNVIELNFTIAYPNSLTSYCIDFHDSILLSKAPVYLLFLVIANSHST